MRITTRVLMFALMCFVSSPISVSQNKGHADETNLYSVALFSSIEKMDADWGYLSGGSSETQIPIDYHHMIVQKDPEITDKLPAKKGEYNVEYLDDREIFAKQKGVKKSIAILKIFPMVNVGDALKINVTVYWVSMEKGKHMYGLSDWSEVTFRYDCDKKEFIVSNIKLGGI